MRKDVNKLAAKDVPLKPATGTGRVDQVIDYIRDYVARENLRPGAKLPSETKLSTLIGVSRPVVREAMRALAGTGLIEMAVGKRAIITPLDGEMIGQVIENAVLIGQADTRNVLELRRSLEIGMVALAATRRSPDDISKLRSLLEAMRKALHAGAEYSALDLRFHLALAEAAGNPLYVILIEAFRQVFEASMRDGMERRSSNSEVEKVQQLHEAITEAVIAGDPAGASRAMSDHFDEAYDKFWSDRIGRLSELQRE
ncbi:FadR/GntR family transcriptional regulator [Asticcacaulis sp. 201]|uniref:FadR/GntR family transcriptional regulator n=1 Tax=Asticcacaulis sp. 201 TaxID=3028787 RepID=UPI0029167CD6|nr:FadR/GntR family transcriptional regulator [Asticcacaulis sp. 201]MDV6330226.1 FadR/GntR family transcriptional regulator [Asticcacaulis sp. 201]